MGGEGAVSQPFVFPSFVFLCSTCGCDLTGKQDYSGPSQSVVSLSLSRTRLREAASEGREGQKESSLCVRTVGSGGGDVNAFVYLIACVFGCAVVCPA